MSASVEIEFMSFEWLEKFRHQAPKEADYAEKTLAAYTLGMKARGSILGVMIDSAPDCCEAARQLTPGKLYHPKEAPRLPLPNCPKARQCGCVYRPVMSYQRVEEGAAKR